MTSVLGWHSCALSTQHRATSHKVVSTCQGPEPPLQVWNHALLCISLCKIRFNPNQIGLTAIPDVTSHAGWEGIVVQATCVPGMFRNTVGEPWTTPAPPIT
jgi:hypothetical protein